MGSKVNDRQKYLQHIMDYGMRSWHYVIIKDTKEGKKCVYASADKQRPWHSSNVVFNIISESKELSIWPRSSRTNVTCPSQRRSSRKFNNTSIILFVKGIDRKKKEILHYQIGKCFPNIQNQGRLHTAQDECGACVGLMSKFSTCYRRKWHGIRNCIRSDI